MSRPERRRSQRRRARLKVRYWTTDSEAVGYTIDVSATGLFVETRRPPPVGTRLHLELHLKDDLFYAEAVVARSLQPPPSAAAVMKSGMGLRLVSLQEAVRSVAVTTEAQQRAEGATLELDLSDPLRLLQVYSQEVRRGGLFVPGDYPVQEGEHVSVRVLLPHPAQPLSARGKVVSALRHPQPGVGLQLEDLDYLRGQLEALLP